MATAPSPRHARFRKQPNRVDTWSRLPTDPQHTLGFGDLHGDGVDNDDINRDIHHDVYHDNHHDNHHGDVDDDHRDHR